MEGQCASEPGIIHVVERSETGASVSGWHCTIKYKEKEITTTGSSRGGFDGSFTPSMPTSFVVVDANSRNGMSKKGGVIGVFACVVCVAESNIGVFCVWCRLLLRTVFGSEYGWCPHAHMSTCFTEHTHTPPATALAQGPG